VDIKWSVLNDINAKELISLWHLCNVGWPSGWWLSKV